MSTLFSSPLQILTIDSPNNHVLYEKTTDLDESELDLAQNIGKQLIRSLAPYQPAAGLAAPQIGINRSVFIYSYNRDPQNLEIVINPRFSPITSQTEEGWEGCLSVILCQNTKQLAKLTRYESIDVSYINSEGMQVEKTLSGFAAKVFQHEYDHLQGIINICRKDASIASFNSEKEMSQFLQDVKEKDCKRY